ncbi:hypothetical protein K466DRAFT_607370, partial [Polyporus arcularius HHB13444]
MSSAKHPAGKMIHRRIAGILLGMSTVFPPHEPQLRTGLVSRDATYSGTYVALTFEETFLNQSIIGVTLSTLVSGLFTVLTAVVAYVLLLRKRPNESLETYLQTTLAGGFISIGMDLMQLTRAMLVNATKGSEVLASEARSNKSKQPDCGSASDASLPTADAFA